MKRINAKVLGNFIVLFLSQILFLSAGFGGPRDFVPVARTKSKESVATTVEGDKSLKEYLTPSVGETNPSWMSRQVSKVKQWAQDEWERASINGSVPIEFLDTQKDNGFSADGVFRYRVSLRPAGIKNYQDRRDTWEIDLSTAYAKDLGINLNFLAEMTFARLFEPQDKIKIWRMSWFWNFPYQAKEMLTNFIPGEVVRLRLSTSAGLGQSENLTDRNDADQSDVVLGFGATRGAQLLIDVYRLQGTKVQVNIAGIKTPLLLNAGLTTTQWLPFGTNTDFGVFSALNKVLNRLVRSLTQVQPFALTASISPTNETRADTSMASYVLDLDTEEGVKGYAYIMRISTVSKLFSELNLIFNQKQMGQRLRELGKPLDEVFFADYGKKEDLKRIDRAYQGRALTDLTNLCAVSSIMPRIFFRGSLCREYTVSDLQVVSLKTEEQIKARDAMRGPALPEIAGVKSLHSSETLGNLQEVVDTYKFVGASRRSEWNLFFRLRGETDARSSFNLFLTEPSEEKNSIVFTPTAMNDQIFRRDFTGKNMNPRDIANFKAHLEYIHPEVSKVIDWKNLADGNYKKNAYIRIEYIFHEESLRLLPPWRAEKFHAVLRSLLSKHPVPEHLLAAGPSLEKYSSMESLGNLDLYEDELRKVDGTNVKTKDWNAIYNRLVPDKFERDIRKISKLLEIITRRKSENLVCRELQGSLLPECREWAYPYMFRFSAAETLLNNLLFMDIGPGLWVTLLPKESQENYFTFNVILGDGNGTAGGGAFGKEPMTAIFNTVQAQLGFLANREFDIRLRIKAVGIDPSEASLK